MTPFGGQDCHLSRRQHRRMNFKEVNSKRHIPTGRMDVILIDYGGKRGQGMRSPGTHTSTSHFFPTLHERLVLQVGRLILAKTEQAAKKSFFQAYFLSKSIFECLNSGPFSFLTPCSVVSPAIPEGLPFNLSLNDILKHVHTTEVGRPGTHSEKNAARDEAHLAHPCGFLGGADP